jgi:hypothetical protein
MIERSRRRFRLSTLQELRLPAAGYRINGEPGAAVRL